MNDNTISLASLQMRWSNIVEQIKRKMIATGVFLDSGLLESFENGHLVILFDKEDEFYASSINKTRPKLEATLSEILGFQVTISCRTGD